MATVTKSRNYPVERRAAFAYLTNPSNWPDYYSGIIAIDNADSATFEQTGDSVRFTYSLLGKRLEGKATIDEVQAGELVRHTATVPGLPDVHQTWEYHDDDNDGLTLDVTLRTEESTSFLGKKIDQLVVPQALQRDIERTLDKLEDVFALGIPDA
jgi:hypothetical protein